MTDREKLIELLNEATEKMDCPQMHELADYLIANGVVIKKKGEWIKFGYKWMCSNCKSILNLDGTPRENNIFSCPNCGSDMRGRNTTD